MGLAGLSQINLELTSRCNKSCAFCGHQSPKWNPTLEEGEIDWKLFLSIIDQLADNTIVQLHRDGEPLLYSELFDALSILTFSHMIVSIVTNGKLLVEKAVAIIGYCTTLTVSAFYNDPDGPEQLKILREFLRIKGDSPPMVNVKIVGFMPPERRRQYELLGVPIIHRLMHVPSGDTRYVGGRPTIPEHGICLDMLHHPSIDWRGRLYICNRLDPHGFGLLGDLNENTLQVLWNSPKRMEWLEAHKRGRRDQASELCKDCLFYGVPTGAEQ